MKKLIVFSVVVILFMSGFCMSHISEAEAPTQSIPLYRIKKEWTSDSIKTMILFVSREYNYNAKPLLWLADKESSYRYAVVGDSGLASGLFQYHTPTWKHFQKKYNLEYLDINNPVDQVIMTIYALRDEQHYNWTPYLTYKNAPK